MDLNATLEKAWKEGNEDELILFTKRFHTVPGERPMFSAFERDVRSVLKKPNWLPCVIDIFGLFHHYPYIPEKPNCFALME